MHMKVNDKKYNFKICTYYNVYIDIQNFVYNIILINVYYCKL